MATQILDVLQGEQAPDVLWFLELQLGAGIGGVAQRRIDLLKVETAPSRTHTHTTTAYEIKVSRADFRKDLAQPKKQRGARLFYDFFYYATPPEAISRRADPVRPRRPEPPRRPHHQGLARRMTADLQTALNLAAQGFRVFPLEPNGRTPVFTGWPNKATTDRATIERWWRDPVTGWGANWGVGVATGRGLVVVDLDVKNGKDGSRALALLESVYDDLPATLRVRTPSGGLHLYFKSDRPIRNSASKIADGIDIRGEGGFVVGPGTEIRGKRYEVTT